MVVKSRWFSSSTKVASKGASCSRRIKRCLMRKSWPSDAPLAFVMVLLAFRSESVQIETHSWARPSKIFGLMHR